MRPGGGHGMRFEKAKNVKGATRRLLGYLRPHRLVLITVFVLATFGTAMALLGPYLMGVAINSMVAGESLSALLRIAGIMLAAYIISWIANNLIKSYCLEFNIIDFDCISELDILFK